MSLRAVILSNAGTCGSCPPEVINCWHSGQQTKDEWAIGLFIRSYSAWGCKIIEARLPKAHSKRLRKLRKRMTKRAVKGLTGFKGGD